MALNRETISDTQTEFAVRYYRWAHREFQQEVLNDFPWLKRLDIRAARTCLRQMAHYSLAEKKCFASALVKRFHPQAVKLLGDSISSSESRMIGEYTNSIVLMLDPAVDDFAEERLPPESISAVGPREMKRVLKKSLAAVLGQEREVGGGTWKYVSSKSHAEIQTWLDVGGSNHQACYHHTVVYSGRILLLDHVSVLSWLGLSGQTCWCSLDKVKAGTTAYLVRDLCAHFLNATAALLDELP